MNLLRQLLEKAQKPFSTWRLGATTTILVCWLSFIALWFNNLPGIEQVGGADGRIWRILSSLSIVVTAYTGTRIILGSPNTVMRYAFLFTSLIAWSLTALFAPLLAPFLLIFGVVSIAAFGMQYPKNLFWPFGLFLFIILIPVGRDSHPIVAIFLAISLIISLLAAQRLLAVRELMITMLDKEVMTQRLALQQQSQQIRDHLNTTEANQLQIAALKERYDGLKRHVARASETGQLFMRQATIKASASAWLEEAMEYFPSAAGAVYYQVSPDARFMPLATIVEEGLTAEPLQKPVSFTQERINQSVTSPEIWVTQGERHCLLGFRDIEDFAFFIHLIQPERRTSWTRDDIAWLRLISTAASGSMSSHLVRQERDELRKQDQILNQVMGEIYRSLDVRTVLQNTAHQLGKSLNSPHVRIRILPTDEGGPS